MTIVELQSWIRKNPQHWQSADRSVGSTDFPYPDSYHEFLEKIGPGVLFDSYYLFDEYRIHDATEFIQQLSRPEFGSDFSGLTAFCSLGYDSCHLCFDGERIVDFDPLEPSSIETIVANTFEEFLAIAIQHKGNNFWLRSEA